MTSYENNNSTFRNAKSIKLNESINGHFAHTNICLKSLMECTRTILMKLWKKYPKKFRERLHISCAQSYLCGVIE